MRNYYIFISILTALVVLILSVGFYITGSPLDQRMRTYDATRISDFRNIKSSIEYYYSTNSKLPSSLTDVSNSNKTDPETKKPYEYKIVTNTSYQLCTTFSTNPDQSNQNMYYTQYEDEFKYTKGYNCIPVKISQYMIDNNVNKNVQNQITQYPLTGVQSKIEIQPLRPYPNNYLAGISAGPLIFNLVPNAAQLYNTKDNPDNYLLLVYMYINTTDPSCDNKTTDLKCYYDMNKLGLKTEKGDMLSKNLVGIPGYVSTESLTGMFSDTGRITSTDTAPVAGGVGFYLPKTLFSNIEKSAKLQIFVESRDNATEKSTADISIKILE